VIKVCNLHKRFGNNHVLRGVNLEINDGEIVTIIGSSGCGKTVLLKHIAGLMKPDEGEIYVDGVEITKLPEKQIWNIQRLFGYVFQGSALFDSLTVGENVAFGLRNLKLSKDEVARRVKECLSWVGLEGKESLYPAELSGGMKKRVSLARAIAYGPKYVLYDEPTVGLDPIIADSINELIIHLQKTLDVTSIVVTHDLRSACRISNRVGMLHNGKIIEIGTPEEIRNSSNDVVRKFLSYGGIE